MEQQISDFKRAKRGLCSKGKMKFGSTSSPLFSTHFYQWKQNIHLISCHWKSEINIAGMNFDAIWRQQWQIPPVAMTLSKCLHTKHPFFMALFFPTKLIQRRAEATRIASLQEVECRELASPAASGVWQSWGLQLLFILPWRGGGKISRKQ